MSQTPAPDLAPVQLLPVRDIEEDPNQPRKRFSQESLHELASLIEAAAPGSAEPWVEGLLHPVVVYPNPGHQEGSATAPWRLKVGARRLRAYRLRGWPTIPARLDRRPQGSIDLLVAQLAENQGREATSLWEDSLAVLTAFTAWKELHPAGKAKEFAAEIRRSPAWLSQHLSVARARDLPRQAACEGHIQHAEAFRLYALLPIELQRQLLARARRDKAPITVATVKEMAPARFAPPKGAGPAARPSEPPTGPGGAPPPAGGEAPPKPAAPARSLGNGTVVLRLSHPQLRLLLEALGQTPPEGDRELLRAFVRALEERTARPAAGAP